MSSFGHHDKGRLEDARMLTGTGRYVSDWNLPRQASGHFLRSDRPHAKIGSIDASAALAMPGVIAVITGEELVSAGLKPIPAAAPFKWSDGSEQRPALRHSLAHEVVRHVGEPVALIVAETAAQAQDAAEAVAVEYEGLEAVTTAAEALAAGAPQLHAGAPGNLVLDFEGGDAAATEAAFKKAHKVVKLRAYHSRVVGNPMEPRAAMGSYDPAKDCTTCTAPPRASDQCAGNSRPSLAWRRKKCAWSPRRSAAASACASMPIRNTARCFTRRKNSAGR
jgi:carbon-monoxide dehydrogenase large subunit